MSQEKRIGIDFTQGPITPLLVRYCIPFLLANILNSLYNTVDTIVIGQFVGGVGIVAVNMGGKTLNMFSMVGSSLAGGGQTLIAQLTGARRRDDINSTIGTLFSTLLILAVATAGILIALAGAVLRILNTPAEAFDGAYYYLVITSAGIPLMFGYNAVSAVLRGMGDSKSPLLFIGIAAVFNLIGDIVFIVVFHMGAIGTAIATVMGQGISLIFSIVYLIRRKEQFGFDFRLKSFRIAKDKLVVILKIGLPMALRGIFINGAQLFMMRFVNAYGVAEAAAYSIGDKVYHLSNIFVMAVSQGNAAIIGQNIGADRKDRVRMSMRSTFGIAMGMAIILAAISLLLPKQLFSLFTSEPEVMAYARPIMAVAAFIYFTCALLATYDGVVTGTGAAMLSFLGGMLDGVIFRISFGFLFGWGLHLGVVGFFMGEALARFGPVSVGMIYYHTGAWKRKKKLIE